MEVRNRLADMIREDAEYPFLTEETCSMVSHKRRHILNREVKEFAEWCVEQGKDPDSKIGLAESTTVNYLKRLDAIRRRTWETTNIHTGFTPELAQELAEGLRDDYILMLNGDKYSQTSKRKLTDALSKYFTWKSMERGGQDWECDIDYNEDKGESKDSFGSEEVVRVREASVDYKTLPSYNNVTPEERDRLKAHLAQRLGKPKEEVTVDDWQRENRCWKIPSLVYVSFDAGLRPSEVKQVSPDWLRLEKNTLCIPKEYSVKNREEWEVALTGKTSTIVEKWIQQRDSMTKYDNTDAMWLTREGTRYGSGSLSDLIDGLVEEAGINSENRDFSWYSIRHTVGDGIGSEGNLAHVMAQLRQKSLESALQYVDPSVEDLRDIIEGI
jgi:integrase